MSAGALPHIIDFRALAARGVRVSGYLKPENLHRLQSEICSADPAQVVAQFERDEMGRYVCELQVEMTVALPCQRCLEPMDVALSTGSKVAALWSETQANDLPDHLDPLVTEEDTDLWLMVEEELLLALPPYPLHEAIDCGEAVGRVIPESDDPVVDVAPERENPFAVLATLRDGGKKDS